MAKGGGAPTRIASAVGTTPSRSAAETTSIHLVAEHETLFDLNIEEVLENWELRHAIREVIANALDEQLLSQTRPPEITRESDGWHVRDFGRGIEIRHFTQNENPEKLAAPAGIIGKFGVGLKDALATFHRHGIDVRLRSRHGSFRLVTAEKRGFRGITTLHVACDARPVDVDGTDVLMGGVSADDVEAAKGLFLRFSSETTVEQTQYGSVLRRRDDGARVYVNGVYANDEPNFLFSYNITSLTPAMRKRLNRERVNVGRTTYTERVVAILKQSTSEAVRAALSEQALRSKGDQCDEMQWLEVSQLALNALHASGRVTFVTEQEMEASPDVVDQMRRDGYRVVLVGEAQRARLQQQIGTGGPSVRIFDVYVEEYNASFEYSFVEPAQLNAKERAVFELTPALLALVGITGKRAPRVRISETIRADRFDSAGVWDMKEGAVIIKRTQLASPRLFASTLLHEAAHATTLTVDATREFEEVLSTYLGGTSMAALSGRVAADTAASHPARRTRARATR